MCIPAFSFNTKGGTPGRSVSHTHSDKSDSVGGGGEDLVTGHCSIGMEQLCKVAMVSTGGVSGCVTVTRMLANQGRPMYNIDVKTLQVNVSICEGILFDTFMYNSCCQLIVSICCCVTERNGDALLHNGITPKF